MVRSKENLNPGWQHKSGRINYFLSWWKEPKIINLEPGKLLVPLCPIYGSILKGVSIRKLSDTSDRVPNMVGWIMAPKDTQILIPRTCECYLICQKGLCRYNYVKGLEMGILSGISGVSPMSWQGPLRNRRRRQMSWRSRCDGPRWG